jgi:hypothetical protein
MDYVLVTTISLVVLINEVGSSFFKPAKGLRHGFPLSPYLFFLVAYNLSRAIAKAIRVNSFQGIHLGCHERLTHLLFVDDVHIFCFCANVEGRILNDILVLFYEATRMLINVDKSVVYLPRLEADNRHTFSFLFNFPLHELGKGIKYPSFILDQITMALQIGND